MFTARRRTDSVSGHGRAADCIVRRRVGRHRRLCDDLTDEQWALPTDCPGWSVQDHVAHMIGTERMLLGEQPDAAAGRATRRTCATTSARPTSSGSTSYRVARARRCSTSSARSRAPARRVARADAPTIGTARASRRKARARTGSSWRSACSTAGTTTRTSARRSTSPGYLDGPVADLSIGRIPPKGLPYVVGKKAGAPPGSTVVFDVTGDAAVVAAVQCRPKAGPCCSTAPPANPTVDARRWTAARSRASRAAVGTATRRAPRRRADRGRRRARQPRRRQHGVHDLTERTLRRMKALLYGVKPDPAPEPGDRQPPAAQPRAHPDEARRHGRSRASSCPTGS